MQSSTYMSGLYGMKQVGVFDSPVWYSGLPSLNLQTEVKHIPLQYSFTTLYNFVNVLRHQNTFRCILVRFM